MVPSGQTFAACGQGVVTVMSAAVGSEDDNDWVKKFWSLKVAGWWGLGMGFQAPFLRKRCVFAWRNTEIYDGT